MNSQRSWNQPSARIAEGSVGWEYRGDLPSDLERIGGLADRLLAANGVPVDFPADIARLRREDLPARELGNRRDLRFLECFTLDGADTKDMDDAISLDAVDGGYLLGVHIANVAAYVQPGSALDAVACDRGTSIYLPHMTIPMLPPVLSDDLCSLNEGKDREAISVLVHVSKDGAVADYDITASVIRSRRKMSYESANECLGRGAVGTCGPEDAIESQLIGMERIAAALRARRARKGARFYPRNQPKFRFSDDGCVDAARYKSGVAEQIVEEFAVLANRLVADYFFRQGLPMICRAQTESGKRASYRFGGVGHADLALDRYFHFTSPIRRLPDLKVGQMLLDSLEGREADGIWRESVECMGRYLEDLQSRRKHPKPVRNVGSDFCLETSKRSRRAEDIQNACEKACRALFFRNRAGQVFSGTLLRKRSDGSALVAMDDYDMIVKCEDPGRIGIGGQVEYLVTANTKDNTVSVSPYGIWAA